MGESKQLLSDDEVLVPTTSKQSPRPMGQKKAKMFKRGEEHDSASALLEEIKTKNRALINFTNALQRATDVKIITTSLENLDETSKQLLMREKMLLQARIQNEPSYEDQDHPSSGPVHDEPIEMEHSASFEQVECDGGDEEVYEVEYLIEN